MRMYQEPITKTLLFRLAGSFLPGTALLALFGQRLMPVRIESGRAAQFRRMADRRRRD